MQMPRTAGFAIASVAIGAAILLIAALFSYQALFSHPGKAEAATTVIFLTTTGASTWTVPADWNNLSNSIEVIGGGAGGSGAYAGVGSGSGGGGGAYAKATNATLTPGATVNVRVGAGGGQAAAGGDTYFCNSTANCASIAGTAVLAGAKGGGPGTAGGGGVGGTGGQAASGVGIVKFSGGNGGAAGSGGVLTRGGGGGGGSAGPNGAGANGGTDTGFNAGGGGGAANGGVAGSNPNVANTGAKGGNGRSGAGGGTGGAPNNDGNLGTNGGGGGGGGYCASAFACNGAAGSVDLVFDATHGVGAGGGGGGYRQASTIGGSGGHGGFYGGGGGGTARGTVGGGSDGQGRQGVIVITYTPVVNTAPSVTTSAASGVTTNAMTLNGNISDTGGQNATVRGFAWGTNPTLSTGVSTTSESGSFGTGAFTSALSSLTQNTTYYYRSYATNPTGTGYGAIMSTATLVANTAPSVTTSAASGVTTNAMTLNGNVTATGGQNATVRGFAWGTNPTLSTGVSTTTESGSFSTGAFTYAMSLLTQNTSYYFRAYATNPTGTGYGAIMSTTTLTSVPGAPGTPTFTNLAQTTMTVSWSAASGATSYSVERCSGAGCASFSVVNSTTGLSFADSGLTASTSYSYRVRASNVAGNGPYSGTGTQVTLSNVPSAPGTPTFSTVTQTSMRVNWTVGAGATSYKVERCTGAGCSNFVEIESDVNATYFDDSGLSPGTSYSYRVRGTNVSGDGAYSGIGTQVTGALPGTPGTPTFTSVTALSMRVNWSAASGATSYTIERCTGAGCSNFTQLATGISTLYFDDAALTPSTSYSYRVRATNVQGDGAYSGVSSQITSASGGGAAVPITGWAWSDTIGWIDLNCSNLGVCGTNSFGLSVDTANGQLSGYAWSDTVGWISAYASDMAGCPTAPCTAVLNTTALTGWLKVVSGGSSQSGGWDGYIALNDKNTGDAIAYGVTYSAGNFTGYGWGSTNVGWVDFSLAHSLYNTCTPATTYTCANTVTIVRTVTTAQCQTTVTNPYIICVAPQFCSVGSPVCITPQPDGVTSGTLTGHLTVKPNLVALNATTTVYWAISNVQTGSCTVTADDGSPGWSGAYSATSSCPTKNGTGCVSSPIVQQTTYRLSCLDFDGRNYVETATVNLAPGFEENCNPGFVHVGGTCVRQ